MTRAVMALSGSVARSNVASGKVVSGKDAER